VISLNINNTNNKLYNRLIKILKLKLLKIEFVKNHVTCQNSVKISKPKPIIVVLILLNSTNAHKPAHFRER